MTPDLRIMYMHLSTLLPCLETRLAVTGIIMHGAWVDIGFSQTGSALYELVCCLPELANSTQSLSRSYRR